VSHASHVHARRFCYRNGDVFSPVLNEVVARAVALIRFAGAQDLGKVRGALGPLAQRVIIDVN